MRKILLYMPMSLDGYVASDREHPGGRDRRGRETKALEDGPHQQGRARLMGRTSYEQMSSLWPQSTDVYAAPMSHIPKVVFSRTLADASWPTRRESVLHVYRPQRF
jgi:dihydrofolate reductase